MLDSLSSLSSRGWFTWCLRRRGGLRTCSALWSSSVSYMRKRKRRAGLCPAFLIGCCRPYRVLYFPHTANKKDTHSLTLISCSQLFARSCLITPSVCHCKHNAISILEKFIHLNLSMEVFVFFIYWQPWMDQSPFNTSMFLFSDSPL